MLLEKSHVCHSRLPSIHFTWFSISEVLSFLEVPKPFVARTCFYVEPVQVVTFFGNSQAKALTAVTEREWFIEAI